MGASPAGRDRTFAVFNAVLSAGALAFLAFILLGRRGAGSPGSELAFLPAVNAAFNATAATLLSAGFLAIRRGQRRLHKFLMLGALVASVLFLVSYVTYHSVHGDTRFAGEGVVRMVYLGVLASHVLLSLPVVPLSLTVLYLAVQGRFDAHRRVARWTLPIWLYVSVTGVVVFFMLRGSLP